MEKKFTKLIERNNLDELNAYFDALPEGQEALDADDELQLLEVFPLEGVKNYSERFRFTEKGEIVFVVKAPSFLRLPYIQRNGLRVATQKYIIDNKLEEVALEFMRMRHFFDLAYLIENGSPQMIRDSLKKDPLENDEQVLLLLHHPNRSLFVTYINCGHYISERVIQVIIEERHLSVFRALLYAYYRVFKKKIKKKTYAELREQRVSDIMLSDKMQIAVLATYDRTLIEDMLKVTPLCPQAQARLFKENYDAEWFKFHVEHLYGVGGYRFEPEYEAKLFKILASKDMDDCLTRFRQQDDVSFVMNASEKAVLKYMKSFRLSDEAQVALIRRGNVILILALIETFSPEHGMCWQAEVALVEICSPETIMKYIAFHSMCGEALIKLRAKSQEAIDFYYAHHAY